MTEEQPHPEDLAPRDPRAPEADEDERPHAADEPASGERTEGAPAAPHGDPLTDPPEGTGRPVPGAREEPPAP